MDVHVISLPSLIKRIKVKTPAQMNVNDNGLYIHRHALTDIVTAIKFHCLK